MVENGYVDANVLNAIPHREPFLFVDRIVELTDEKIVTERVLKKEELFFKGHYPQMPIMPGVLMCEAIFQTAGVFMSKKLLNEAEVEGKVPVLTRIESAKFKKMAFPGDVLQLEAQFVQKLKDFYFFKGCAKKDGQLLVSIEFILGMVNNSSL
ncbi:MAG: 3-hydroxyacyl-ACP dehydratase FabZ [Opitutales bacterium]